MTIKEEANKILKSRKIWGDIWDEYELETLIDIIRGKTQRTWNLLQEGNYKKAMEELIDIYNYVTKLKERLQKK